MDAPDVIRSVAMGMVVLSHFSLYAYHIPENLTVQLLLHCQIIHFIQSATQDCNTIFVLLTGYLIIKSKLKVSSVFRYLGMVLFYSLGLYAVGVFTGLRPLSWEHIYLNLNCLYQYWFFRYYIYLCCFIPFLNALVSKLNRQGFQILLLMMLIVCTIFQTPAPRYNNIALFGSGTVLLSFFFTIS